MRTGSFLGSPWLYLAWSLFVCTALGTTYFIEPHLFAFTTMVLGGVTCLVGVGGLVVVLRSGSCSRSARVVIVAALAVAAGAIWVALETLGTFKWA